MKKLFITSLICAAFEAQAQWPGWTTDSRAISLANSATSACSTADAVLYNAASPCSTQLTFSGGRLTASELTVLNAPVFSSFNQNRVPYFSPGGVLTENTSLLFSTTLVNSGHGLRVGLGDGIYIGYSGSPAIGALFPSSVTPTITNSALRASSAETWLNVTAGGYVYLSQGNVNKMTLGPGEGPLWALGLINTDSYLARWHRTNNSVSIVKGVEVAYTDTQSAADFLPFRVLGGASGTRNLFSVGKQGNLSAGAGNIIIGGDAPTIGAGFCTSPAVTTNNGTAQFVVTIGTSCSGVTSGTVTMPAASNVWSCHIANVTSPASNTPSQTGGTTTTVTVTNYSRTTGLAADFTDSEVLRFMCLAG